MGVKLRITTAIPAEKIRLYFYPRVSIFAAFLILAGGMIIFYKIFRAFTRVVSRLPFPVLYWFSVLIRFFLQYILRYRRQITLANLERSFPEKSRKEIRAILGHYYRNLAEIMLEVIKLETVKPEALKNRFTINGFEHIQEAFDRGRSVIVAIGHCGNWEWMGTVLGQMTPVKGFAIVKPLSEAHFNRYMESLRHRINPDSTIPFHHTYRALVRNRKNFISFNVFASDQTPIRSDINYWSHFLNQDTPFYTGIEKISRSLDFSVVFVDIFRTERGKYRAEIQLITHDPAGTSDLEITDTYIRMLEEAIRLRPDNWLWSHRRWKFYRNSVA
jgi:KDO2-lipid IV(A) lauroyltransferase